MICGFLVSLYCGRFVYFVL
uniref:Uncharacterized protein n=1 Tax=Rhizophora mucronata TaxID=61149 RepID=A0A2P2PH16_RHIMU